MSKNYTTGVPGQKITWPFLFGNELNSKISTDLGKKYHGGSTALHAVYTVDTVDMVYAVDTVDMDYTVHMVYTVQMVFTVHMVYTRLTWSTLLTWFTLLTLLTLFTLFILFCLTLLKQELVCQYIVR